MQTDVPQTGDADRLAKEADGRFTHRRKAVPDALPEVAVIGNDAACQREHQGNGMFGGNLTVAVRVRKRHSGTLECCQIEAVDPGERYLDQPEMRRSCQQFRRHGLGDQYTDVAPVCYQLSGIRDDLWARTRVARTLCRLCLLYTSPSPRDRTRSRMP